MPKKLLAYCAQAYSTGNSGHVAMETLYHSLSSKVAMAANLLYPRGIKYDHQLDHPILTVIMTYI